jgi:hypothetical protein
MDYLEYDYFEQRLDYIVDLLRGLCQKGDDISAELDRLKVAVQNCTTVGDSLVTLVQGLSAQLAAAKNDPAAIQAISDELGAKGAAWQAAVTANTPVTGGGGTAAPTPPASAPGGRP